MLRSNNYKVELHNKLLIGTQLHIFNLLTVLFMDSSRRTTTAVTTRWGPSRMHLQKRQFETASIFIWMFQLDFRVNSPTTGNKDRGRIHPRITRNEFF